MAGGVAVLAGSSSARHVIGRAGLNPAVAPGGGPVVAQVDDHRAPVARWCGDQAGQRAGLELDHLRLVHLVDDRAADHGSR